MWWWPEPWDKVVHAGDIGMLGVCKCVYVYAHMCVCVCVCMRTCVCMYFHL